MNIPKRNCIGIWNLWVYQERKIIFLSEFFCPFIYCSARQCLRAYGRKSLALASTFSGSSGVRDPLEVGIFSIVNAGVLLSTVFRHHPPIDLIWLKYCIKWQKIASHSFSHFQRVEYDLLGAQPKRRSQFGRDSSPRKANWKLFRFVKMADKCWSSNTP